jgi:cobalt-zinc-cadmium efflux system outer membrane protein
VRLDFRVARRFSAVFGALVVCAATAAGQTPSSPLSLADAFARALEANPAVRAARLQRAVDTAGIAVAGERPNPDLAYELSKETPRQSIGVTLPIELGRKRSSRLDLARATAAVSEAELDRLVSETRNDVRRAYFDLVAARLRVDLLTEVRALADRARGAAAARVNAGDVPRADLTQADLAVALSESDLIAARGEAASARVSLNLLLGQPPDTAIAPTDALETGSLMPAAEAAAAAMQSSTELQAIDRRIAEQRMKIALARAMTKPDVSAGTALTYDAEPEFKYGWRLSAGVTIPGFTTHRATVVVEDAVLARLIAERDAAAARVVAAVAAAVERATAARAQVTHYQATILPLAAEAERQAQAAYAGGQTGLPALVQALQTARETRQRGLEAGLDYQHALADLERAIGAPIK